MTIKILLVDDHTVVRSGLSKFLLVNKDLKLVGEASDGAEAIQMVSLHKPDVVLMDLMMPGVDGITATREIHKKYPQVKVIALTSFAEQNMVQGALVFRVRLNQSYDGNAPAVFQKGFPLAAQTRHLSR